VADATEKKAIFSQITGMGDECNQRAADLGQQIQLCDNLVGSTSWTGTSADKFKQTWPDNKKLVEDIKAACDELGSALKQISQQYQVGEDGVMSKVTTAMEKDWLGALKVGAAGAAVAGAAGANPYAGASASGGAGGAGGSTAGGAAGSGPSGSLTAQRDNLRQQLEIKKKILAEDYAQTQKDLQKRLHQLEQLEALSPWANKGLVGGAGGARAAYQALYGEPAPVVRGLQGDPFRPFDPLRTDAVAPDGSKVPVMRNKSDGDFLAMVDWARVRRDIDATKADLAAWPGETQKLSNEIKTMESQLNQLNTSIGDQQPAAPAVSSAGSTPSTSSPQHSAAPPASGSRIDTPAGPPKTFNP
jgi:uncharacterized protein YukE